MISMWGSMWNNSKLFQGLWPGGTRKDPCMIFVVCWFLDSKKSFSPQTSNVSGMTFEVVFEPCFQCSYSASGFPWFGFCRSARCPRSPQKWGWACGFCRPESFLFTCYALGFVEAVLVFSRDASTKFEASTPPGQFLRVSFRNVFP